MKLSDKLIDKETIYQRIARELGVSTVQVGRIARGERKGTRGKGLLIKQKIEEILNKKE